MPVNSLVGHMAGKFLQEHHPTFQESLCVEHTQSRIKCNLCVQACPHGALDEQCHEPRPELCDDCGICVAQCPVNGFVPSVFTAQAWQDIFSLAKEKPVLFSCRQTDANADVRLDCLGALPWELLAVLMTEQAFSYVHGNCDDCTYSAGGICFRKTLEKLRGFFGEAFAEEKILPPEQVPVKKELSRREALGKLLQAGRKTAFVGLPSFLQASQQPRYLRRLLRNTIVKHKDKESFSVRPVTPVFNEECIACGICTKVCPTKSLEIIPSNEHLHQMVHHPWKCGGCGICQSLCPHKGIEYLARATAALPDKPFVTNIETASCSDCGGVCGKNHSRCMACEMRAVRNAQT